MKRTGPTNLELRKMIEMLREKSSKEHVNIWRRVAEDLSYSTRRRREVNLSRIARVGNGKETLVVPGKVLGIGHMDKNVNVAAWRFSKSARDKLGSKAISLAKLVKDNPKGKGVRIIG